MNCASAKSNELNSELLLRCRSSAESIQSARDAHALSGLQFSGPTYLDSADLLPVLQLIRSDPLILGLIGGRSQDLEADLTTLLERFLELKRRRHLPVTLSRWEARTLCIELVASSDLLTMRSKQLIGAVLINSQCVGDIPCEPDFRELALAEMGTVRSAVRSRPSDPRGFLRQYMKKCKELLNDPSFSDFHANPGIIRLAAHGFPTDPEMFLIKVRSVTANLILDPEIAALGYSPSNIRETVARLSKDPRARLLLAAADAKEILTESEFENFSSQPALVRQICLAYKDARATLRRIALIMQQILQDERFAEFSPSFVQAIIFDNLTNAKAVLEQRLGEYNSVLSDPEFSSYRETPSFVLDAIRQREISPENFLRELERGCAEILCDARFAELKETPGMVRQMMLSNPRDPKSAIARAMAAEKNLFVDARFSDLTPTPWVFREAVVGHPTDPAGFLTNVLSAILVIKLDPEFAGELESPSYILHAAVKNSNDPKGFLRRVAETSDKIAGEPEFMNIPMSFIKRACISHASAPRLALRKALAHMSMFESYPEFVEFTKSRGQMFQVILLNLQDPLAALRRNAEQISSIAQNAEFAEFHGYPDFVRGVVFNTPRRAEAVLREIALRTREIIAEPEFTAFADRRHAVHNALWVHRRDPRARLRAIA